MSTKQWLMMAAGLLVVIPVSQCLGRTVGQFENSSKLASRSVTPNVGRDTRVVVSKQDAEGVSNEQVSLEFAQAVGDYSLERMRYHVGRILEQQGGTLKPNSMRQETVLIDNDGLNIMVTRVYFEDVNYAVQFAAIQGSELTRVLCMAGEEGQPVLLAGNCSDKLETLFSFDALGLGHG